jgi:hypothetical protein
VEVGRVKEGNQGDSVWLIDFIYLYETELKKPPATALSEVGRGLRGRDNGGNVNSVQYRSNWNCHYESPHIMNVSK